MGVSSRAKVLLVQVRETAEVAAHERVCVVERSGLSDGQIESINVVDTPDIDWDLVKRSDAVLFGGAGVHSATKDYAFTQQLMEMVRRVVLLGTPMFGSCFGHQFIARALGGEVVHDPERSEVGLHDVMLTDATRGDDLFGACPMRIAALMGHQDRVTRLPDGAVELAASAVCGNQAFRLVGKPVYGTQFHAELTSERILERLSLYREIYMPDDEEFARMRDSLGPTPEAGELMRRFLEVFVSV
jgi:GMP synthase (glutamine-hydrolysing)